MKYAARRLLHSLILLAGVSILSFLFAELAPGDFFSEMRLEPGVTTGTVDALRARHGLDRPLPVRYAAWLGSVARGEFGYSLAYNSAVGPLLRQRIPGTLLLTATATLLAWLLAIPLGVWSAAKRGTWPDLILKVILSFTLGFRPVACTPREPKSSPSWSDSATSCAISRSPCWYSSWEWRPCSYVMCARP